jgi:predicted ATPase
MRPALTRHDELLRTAIEAHGGYVFATGGDGLAVAFARAGDAIAAALVSQASLAVEAWPDEAPIRVRMGLHTGEVEERGGDYFGPAVNRAARLAAAAHGGQVVCSAVTAGLADPTVALRSLGEHRLRDLASPEVVFQLGDGSFPRLRSLDAVPTNLPTVRTELIGRAADIAELTKLVEREHLVTLTGTGGVGKTRLGLAVAAAAAPGFADGCWLVELAPVATAEELVKAVAAVLGAPVADLGALAGYLADRRALILLDNCEHLAAEAADLVDAVLATSPEVHLLVTSREPMGVTGEQVRRVESLAVPAADASVELAEKAPAVRLFVDRAAAVNTRFVLTDANVEAVVAICRHLDGIPLAVELAAARARAMSPADIAGRLGERFRLLAAGSRRTPDRHRTLFAAVAWSYDLLGDDERAVFRSLAVFPSSFDLAAAEAVAGTDADVADVDVIVRLVDRSLLAYDPESGRYRLLETLREYAADRLADAGETDGARARHARHYLELARRTAPELTDTRYKAAHDRMATELENLRTVVQWCAEADRWAELAQTVLGLWHFLFQVGPAVSTEWYERIVGHDDQLDPQAVVDLLGQWAWLIAGHTLNFPLAVPLAERSIRLADQRGLDQCPFALLVPAQQLQLALDAAGLATAERALAAAEAKSDTIAAVVCEGYVGMFHAMLGDAERADWYLTDALGRAEALGHPVAVQATVLTMVSRYLGREGEPDLLASLDVLTRHDAPVDDSMAMYTDLFLGTTLSALKRGGAIGRLTRAARVADRTKSDTVSNMALTFIAIEAIQHGYGPEGAFLAGHTEAVYSPTKSLSHAPRNRWVLALRDELLLSVEGYESHIAAGKQASRSVIMALISRLESEITPPEGSVE